MLRFRSIVTAFLMWNSEILMQQRSMDKKIAPGAWFGVGGHMEVEELNNPYKAIYREIYEETGIDSEKIQRLDLKYILYNRWLEEEIVINHIFFGQVTDPEVHENNEGNLHWLSTERALDKISNPALKKVIYNYFHERSEDILIGIVNGDESDLCYYPIWKER